MRGQLQKLTPSEELRYLQELYGAENIGRILDILTRNFDVLQARAQLLLSLVALCLTITGFSGPKIAASGPLARGCVGGGLALVLVAALLLLLGPLQLRWVTREKAGDTAASLEHLIRRRNARTALYHAAAGFLIVGLAGYVGGVVAYLLCAQGR